MKKMMLIGSVGCGKTTLTQLLNDQAIEYNKTQQIEYISSMIDTPGEFIQHRNLYSALITASVEAKLLLLLASATESKQVFSPLFAKSFNKPAIGIVTKIDLATPEQIEKIRRQLHLAGVSEIYEISATTGEGIAELKQVLKEKLTD